MREVWISETTLYGTKPRGRPDRLVLPKANIHAICEPLLGSSYVDSEKKIKAKYLSLEECTAVYEKALHAYVSTQDRELLLQIALYRRNVTPPEDIFWCGDIDADDFFLECVFTLEKPFTRAEWQELKSKMPAHSSVYRVCEYVLSFPKC